MAAASEASIVQRQYEQPSFTYGASEFHGHLIGRRCSTFPHST